ncbi:putative protein phosphatase 4 core regulatory subunit r2 protein [Lasiodiplodia theobromae]|uniref:Protein phosphatase 4 core regulatory subunit r2 n=1 Tax=Lasiodiplodia theobromae TaxID=45133 RepID=UPI0015C3A5E3|nr:Protein phosphatase 4 core regulatory subunit r2 [Lasiodiplodia theobromae]KAF4542371.1 Protein phosphatase 4 core regulatory subunit r2 [Lasiodiplodia theobromae]KAF9635833.1 putative protein phosphatase 4 core regulatory subunit r2 protein [Lasiodiplodia theobromae]
MLSGEQLLEQAAKDGSMVPSEWPRALEIVLSRLEHIVSNEFPTPTIPPPTADERERSATPSKPPLEGVPASQETTTADKENAPPASSSNAAATVPNAAAQNTPSPGPSAQALSRSGSQDANSAPSPTVVGGSGAGAGDGGNTTEAHEAAAATSSLPPELANLYTSIVGALQKQFGQEPPHTVQRLAELALYPQAHYRFLPPYLRALDRVVSVSSSTTVFPLPQAAVPASTGILNGITPTSSTTPAAVSPTAAALGSDESLGGALLTPIPWLQNRGSSGAGGSSSNANGNSELISESTEMVDGPNGAGRIETVSVINGALSSTTSAPSTGAGSAATATTSATTSPSTGATSGNTAESLREAGAVTQGELLRQEQEAGVVPVGQSNPRRGLLPGYAATAAAASGAAAGGEQKEGEATVDEGKHDEIPHARGPDEVGAEDVGPQQSGTGGINLEAAVGRAPVATTKKDGEGEGDAGETDDGSSSKKPMPEQPLSPEAEMKDVDDADDEEGAKTESGDEKAAAEGGEKASEKSAKETEKSSDQKDDGGKSDTEMTD